MQDNTLKVAVPWPVKTESQPRIREALSLWEDKSLLTVCTVQPTDDPFLDQFDVQALPRDSTSVGTAVPKCFIKDMLLCLRERHPDLGWYGFGNSDCVPVGDILEGHFEYEVLIYHRTDIKEWPHRYASGFNKRLAEDLGQSIWEMRQQGISDKKIAKQLNRASIKPPAGAQEWTYDLIRELFVEQGRIFFWGQDMYLFRRDVLDRVIEEYLGPRDPILGTGGFDPRLSRWCIENFKAARVLNKIFHKEHDSEWNISEVEYEHNGGDIPVEDRHLYYESQFINSLCDKGQKGAIPRYIRYMIGRKNPELASVLNAK